ncbi:MAG TPA: haloacid dehalogenase [Dehalococcoidia bacterium]|nr:haloacid dehalogenase [Dehalococcoidia bacterium]
MQPVSSQLEAIIEGLRAHLNAKHRAREEALSPCREATRLAANAIRAVHRREFSRAQELLARARGLLDGAARALQGHGSVLYAGFLQDAQKELCEGALTLALVAGQPLPTPQEMEVEAAPYLNGLGEAVGELRRHLLDSLRRGDVVYCESLLSAMDEIYGHLVTMDYPEAVTGGLRRTTDAVRGILERTRGDLTLAALQKELGDKLEELRGRL